MRRIALVVAMLALMPLLMGAGGGNPGVPGGFKIAGPTFTASVVIDPHDKDCIDSVFATCKHGSIRVYSNAKTAGGLFAIPPLFPLDLGCDLTKTDLRFRYQPLLNWIPENVLNAIFTQLGTGRSSDFEPIFTKIVNDSCTPDPNDSSTNGPGVLSFQGTVRFLVPDN